MCDRRSGRRAALIHVPDGVGAEGGAQAGDAGGAVAHLGEVGGRERVMDGRNRQRFAEEGQLLGSWISASTVLGTPRPGTESEGGTPAGGEVRPAA
jgi:hypothetical protein